MTLPCTDVAGWRDSVTGALIDVSAPDSYTHTYTSTIRFLDSTKHSIGKPVTLRPFVLPRGDGSTVDLDKLLPVPGVAGGSVLVPDSWSALVADAVAAAAAAAIGNAVRARALAASAAAVGRSSLDLGVMSSPPTVATSATDLDATLTRTYGATTTPTAFTTSGGIPTVFSTTRWVFPVCTAGAGSGNLGGTANANGYAIDFMADADKVEILLLVGTSPKGVMIEVDGQMIQSTPLAWVGASTMYILLTFASRAVRHIRVEMDSYGGFRGVNVPPTGSIWPVAFPGRIKASVVGDSLGAQTGYSRPNGGFAYSLGKLLGWADVRSASWGGSGYVATGAAASTFGSAVRVADVVAANPDLIVIPGSGNDNGLSGVPAAALAAWVAYRAALPTVPIIVGGLFPGVGGPSAATLATENALKATFDTWADPHSYWVPISTDPGGAWFAGTGRVSATNGSGNTDLYVGSDGIHPSQAGHDFYARQWARAITAIIPNL